MGMNYSNSNMRGRVNIPTVVRPQTTTSGVVRLKLPAMKKYSVDTEWLQCEYTIDFKMLLGDVIHRIVVVGEVKLTFV